VKRNEPARQEANNEHKSEKQRGMERHASMVRWLGLRGVQSFSPLFCHLTLRFSAGAPLSGARRGALSDP
jgi:hypothetical protein